MADRDLITEGPVVPTYDERIAEGNRALEQVVRLTSLLDRTEEQLTDARARIAELERQRDALRANRDTWKRQAERKRAAVKRVHAALSAQPHCDVHPDDDPVSCGWKRVVADVQHALDATEVNRG